MIVIFEGTNGVGKSTYANALSKKFGAPVIRPFRSGDTDLHWGHSGKDRFQMLRDELRVPVNTHVDDLYVADFLATYQVDAILDRSVPSAVAYGILNDDLGGWYKHKGVPRTLMAFWHSLIKNASHPVVYIWLRASHKMAKQRCDGRWCPNKSEYDKLEKYFAKAFQDIELPKKQIQTDRVDLEDGVKIVERMLKEV